MKDLTIPGHLPGAICPSCNQGFLIVVCRKDRGSNGVYGPGGYSWDFNIIDRVACTHCSISYETSLRGRDFKTHLETQVQDRLYPAEKRPKGKRCNTHPSLDLKESTFGEDAHTYRYCQACLTIYWIGKSEREKNFDRDFAKHASPALLKATSDLSRKLRGVERNHKRRSV